MNARRHDAGSFDWDSDDSDFANMPELLDHYSSANTSDDNSTSSRPIARKKKVVLVSNASDDNESMGKLFASNLKVAVAEMAESNSCAIKLAESIAELKLAGLRVCTSYAEKLDESSACNSEPRIEHLTGFLNLETDNKAAAYVSHAFNAKKTPTRLCNGRTWLRSVLLGSRKPDRMTPSRLCTSAPTYVTCSPRIASKRYFP